jgi:hypothetical protein
MWEDSIKFCRMQVMYESVYRIYLAQETITKRGFVNNVMNLTF